MGKTFHNVIAVLSRSFRIDDEAIEELRVILEEQNGREVSLEEAEKVGRGLVGIAETLANGRTIVAPQGEDGGQQ